MSVSLRALVVSVVSIGVFVSTASAQGPSLGTFRWNLLPYCDALVMEVRPILPDGSAFQLTGTHDRCGDAGFLAIQGNATLQPDGTYQLVLSHASFQGWAEPNFVASISPQGLSGTWAWDGEFGTFTLATTRSGGPRLRKRGNTAFGNGALQIAVGNSRLNSAFGWHALRALTSLGGGVGSVGNAGNTAVGADAGVGLERGADNLFLGIRAGNTLVEGSGNLYLGNSGGPATESNTVRLGGSTHQRTFVAAVSGVATGLNDAVPVVVDSLGQLGTVSSSRRGKDDIHDLAGASRIVQSLRPVQFRYRQPFVTGDRPVQYGLIAEEVASIAPELVAFDADGVPATVKYQLVPTLLLSEVQRLERERATLAGELAALRQAVAALQAETAALKAMTPQH